MEDTPSTAPVALPIAQRTIHGKSSTGDFELLVQIFSPEFCENGEFWKCHYDISCSGVSLKANHAAGNDSMQSIVLALAKIEVELKHSESFKALDLEVCDNEGFGFLPPRSVCDM